MFAKKTLDLWHLLLPSQKGVNIILYKDTCEITNIQLTEKKRIKSLISFFLFFLPILMTQRSLFHKAFPINRHPIRDISASQDGCRLPFVSPMELLFDTGRSKRAPRRLHHAVLQQRNSTQYPHAPPPKKGGVMTPNTSWPTSLLSPFSGSSGCLKELKMRCRFQNLPETYATVELNELSEIHMPFDVPYTVFLDDIRFVNL